MVLIDGLGFEPLRKETGKPPLTSKPLSQITSLREAECNSEGVWVVPPRAWLWTICVRVTWLSGMHVFLCFGPMTCFFLLCCSFVSKGQQHTKTEMQWISPAPPQKKTLETLEKQKAQSSDTLSRSSRSLGQ